MRHPGSVSPLEAESIKTRYALFRQLPRAILHDLFSCVPDVRTELVEAAVFVSIHVDVTVRLRALLEVVNPLVERPCDLRLQLKPARGYHKHSFERLSRAMFAVITTICSTF